MSEPKITDEIMQMIAGDIEDLLLEQREAIAWAFGKIPDGLPVSISVALESAGDSVAYDCTPSEIEAELLEHIECHIRLYSFNNRYNPKQLNAEVYSAFGKPRREMTIAELERCLLHVRTAYPLGRVRGTGIPRVPSRAVPVRVEWRN
jgi:hypothetical protein